MTLNVLWIIIGQLPQILVAAKALTLAIVCSSASASAGCSSSFPLWKLAKLGGMSYCSHTHTHISASKLTHLWKTYENIWTHLKNCGLSPIFHPLPHHSNLLTAAVRLNVTSQVCRKSFRPLVFWWSSPFPAEGLMFDDVWLFDSNENMKTIKRQEPYEIIYIYI